MVVLSTRMQSARYLDRMEDERLPKIYVTTKQEGCRKRGRPQIVWYVGLSEENPKKGRGRKNERKGQQYPIKLNMSVAI